MKVLMLNGSGNANGSTRAGLDVMAEVFAENGVETEIVCVGSKPLHDCIGCGKCAELKRSDGFKAFLTVYSFRACVRISTSRFGTSLSPRLLLLDVREQVRHSTC